MHHCQLYVEREKGRRSIAAVLIRHMVLTYFPLLGGERSRFYKRNFFFNGENLISFVLKCCIHTQDQAVNRIGITGLLKRNPEAMIKSKRIYFSTLVIVVIRITCCMKLNYKRISLCLLE